MEEQKRSSIFDISFVHVYLYFTYKTTPINYYILSIHMFNTSYHFYLKYHIIANNAMRGLLLSLKK